MAAKCANTLSPSDHHRRYPTMTKKSITAANILSKLSDQEKKYRREFCVTFLEYLEKISVKKRITELESIIFETEVKRIITLDQRLSQREKDCLILAYKGKSMKKTGKILNKHIKTVETQRRRLFKKLGVNSIGPAIALGIKYNK